MTQPLNAADIPVYDGDAEVTIDQGAPWVFCCCHCGLSHNLTIYAQDDDTVRMEVSINQEITDQLRAADVQSRRNIRRERRKADAALPPVKHKPLVVILGDYKPGD